MNVLAESRALEEPLVVCSAGAEDGPILDDRTALARRTVRRTHEARTAKGAAPFHLMKTATLTGNPPYSIPSYSGSWPGRGVSQELR